MGKREVLFDGKGGVIAVNDTRTVSEVAAKRITEIKAKCAKAIEETGLSWMVERKISSGKEIPAAVATLCDGYRGKSNDLEDQINALVQSAADDNDKSTCNEIEKIQF